MPPRVTAAAIAAATAIALICAARRRRRDRLQELVDRLAAEHEEHCDRYKDFKRKVAKE